MMRTTLVLILLAVLLVVPASADDPPFGRFGGIVGGESSGDGIIGLHGWALDDDGVAAVDIMVDGLVAGRANYGRPRPGVADGYPEFPDADAAGFGFELDSTRYENGPHTVEAKAISQTGETVTLNPRVLTFTNLSANLVPFGEVEKPLRDSMFFGTCDPLAQQRRLDVVSGWALDMGVELGDTGVGFVELLIDGQIFANTETDCDFDPDLGGLTDCYGLPRLDIEQRFPFAIDAPTSGYRFVLDVGDLINRGVPVGERTLTLLSGDVAGQRSNIGEVPVEFRCDTGLGNEPSFGRIGGPRVGQRHGGVVEVVGWALDFEGVDDIIIRVDGVDIGSAVHGERRPLVTRDFPGYPDSPGPGYRFNLDTTVLTDGIHQLDVMVRDGESVFTAIDERPLEVSNP